VCVRVCVCCHVLTIHHHTFSHTYTGTHIHTLEHMHTPTRSNPMATSVVLQPRLSGCKFSSLLFWSVGITIRTHSSIHIYNSNAMRTSVVLQIRFAEWKRVSAIVISAQYTQPHTNLSQGPKSFSNFHFTNRLCGDCGQGPQRVREQKEVLEYDFKSRLVLEMERTTRRQ